MTRQKVMITSTLTRFFTRDTFIVSADGLKKLSSSRSRGEGLDILARYSALCDFFSLGRLIACEDYLSFQRFVVVIY